MIELIFTVFLAMAATGQPSQEVQQSQASPALVPQTQLNMNQLPAVDRPASSTP